MNRPALVSATMGCWPRTRYGRLAVKASSRSSVTQIEQRGPDEEAEAVERGVERHGQGRESAGGHRKHGGSRDRAAVVREVEQNHQDGVAHGVEAVPHAEGAEIAVHQVVEAQGQQVQQRPLQREDRRRDKELLEGREPELPVEDGQHLLLWPVTMSPMTPPSLKRL